jgi:hypothetical protein
MTLTRRSTLAAAASLTGLVLAASATEAQERHPEIANATRALERARDYLQHASHDFGGHRVAALKECDAAIEQLREAQRFDRH